MTDFAFDDDKKAGTNRHASPTRCVTCGGDRFVTVRLRSPEQTIWMDDHEIRPAKNFYEEVAPCYSCNHEAYGHILYRGFRPLDPALAEQMHKG